MISKTTTIVLLLVVAILIAIIGLFIGPMPQPQTYHNFADQRNWLNVPNGLNVLSNILFALAGMWGLFLLIIPDKVQFADNRERILWIGVSLGLVLTAIGSGYYHWAPDNSRLMWDRLPMTIIFMSLVAALISERIDMRLGVWLWPLLLGIGFFSVLHWQASETQGVGDLRLYLGVQIFTIFAALVMLFAPSQYNRSSDLLIVVFFFGMGRVFEIYDHQIWILTGNIVSGHTLKHLAAGMAGIWLIRMISVRKTIQA